MSRTEVVDLGPVIAEWVQDVDGLCDVVLTAFGQLAAESVIVGTQFNGNLGSPVDTGFLRASWAFRVGSPAGRDAGVRPVTADTKRAARAAVAPRVPGGRRRQRAASGGVNDPTGVTTLYDATRAARTWTPGTTAYLGNSSGYAEHVEALHPTHAGWVRLFAANAQWAMDTVVQELTSRPNTASGTFDVRTTAPSPGATP